MTTRKETHEMLFTSNYTENRKTQLGDVRQHLAEAMVGKMVDLLNGRAVAQLGPVAREQWRRWDDVAAVFTGPVDENWAADRDRIDHAVADPFPG